MTTGTTIDAAVFRELEEATGAEFVVELVSTLFDEAPTMLADLRDARDAGDAERLRRVAHSLKSNARTFGATELAERALAIERDGWPAASDASLDALDDAWDRAATALAAMTHG